MKKRFWIAAAIGAVITVALVFIYNRALAISPQEAAFYQLAASKQKAANDLATPPDQRNELIAQSVDANDAGREMQQGRKDLQTITRYGAIYLGNLTFLLFLAALLWPAGRRQPAQTGSPLES